MTPRAHRIAREILATYAGVWYVAANDTQRAKAETGAAHQIEPMLREIEEKTLEKKVCQDPPPPT